VGRAGDHDTMLDSSWMLWLGRCLPGLVGGPALHRAALALAARGRHAEAQRCFARAAEAYRRDLRVEALARLRAHELMNGLCSGALPDRDGARELELERRLARLERIESPAPPFEVVDARDLLARWVARGGPAASRAS
jgi:hypothetical protein